MIKKFFITIIIYFFLTVSSFSNDLDRNFLIKFDGLCVQNLDKIDLVNNFAVNNNWMSIPPEKQAMIAPRVKGPAFKAYGFLENDIVYLIAINDAEKQNSCTMASAYNSIENYKSILNEFYNLSLIDKINQGIQKIEFYKVNLLQSKF